MSEMINGTTVTQEEVTEEIKVEEFTAEQLESMASDDFCLVFVPKKVGQDSMLEFLTKYQLLQRWTNVKAKNIKVKTFDGGPIMYQSYMDNTDCDASEDVWRYVLDDQGSKFGARIPELDGNNKIHLFSKTALAGAKQRAGVDCTAIERFPLAIVEEFMNKGFQTTTDNQECKVLDIANKIITINGKTYVVFNDAKMAEAIVEMLDRRFPGAEFAGGSFTYEKIEAKWIMPKQAEELLGTYEKALNKSETHVDFSDMIPCIRFFTSDIGDSSAYIDAVLKRGEKFEIKIGTPIKVEHKGCEDESAFIDQLDGLYAQFSDIAAGMAKLANIKITHPVNTMLNIAFGSNIKLGKKATLDAIEIFKSCCSEDEAATAADVFYTLQEALYNMRTSDNSVAETTISNCEEGLMRLLNPAFPWNEFDTEILLSTIQVKLA